MFISLWWLALTKPLSAVPQMEKTDNKLSMSQTPPECCPINVYQIRVVFSNHCVPNTSELALYSYHIITLNTPSLSHHHSSHSLNHSSYPPPFTLNIQPSLPNITLHIPIIIQPSHPLLLSPFRVWHCNQLWGGGHGGWGGEELPHTGLWPDHGWDDSTSTDTRTLHRPPEVPTKNVENESDLKVNVL